jgi:hypothetical protein
VHQPALLEEQAYRGQNEVIRAHAPNAKDLTNWRYRHRGVIDEVERAKNRTKSRVRAKVGHPFRVIKRVFGFVKVRYRGLAKNTQRLWVAGGLSNLSWFGIGCCAPDAQRTLRRQQPLHYPILVRLSVSSHCLLSAPSKVPILSERQLLCWDFLPTVN